MEAKGAGTVSCFGQTSAKAQAVVGESPPKKRQEFTVVGGSPPKKRHEFVKESLQQLGFGAGQLLARGLEACLAKVDEDA